LEKYLVLLIQFILQRLDMEQTAKFQAMIHTSPQIERLQQLLISFNLNLAPIQAEALRQLQVKYLD
jgi:hypothetical protein